jgi:DivIVA domain-containing protein
MLCHAAQRGTIRGVVWLLGILAVVVIGAAVVVGVGRGGALRPAYDDRPDALVPEGAALTGAALRSVRFSVGLRGYRMDEVDALLERLAEQLDERQQIAERQQLAESQQFDERRQLDERRDAEERG